jgi:hypothetical protein
VIVIGTAGETVSYFDAAKSLIFSNTAFHVEVVVRGSVASVITVQTVGGIVNGITQVTEHQPRFTAGQRSRLFLDLQKDSTFKVVGLEAGKQDLPQGVMAADPSCALPPVAVPRTGSASSPEEGRALLPVLLVTTAVAGAAALMLRRVLRP